MSHAPLVYPPARRHGNDFETLARVSRGLEMTDEEKADFFLRHDNTWI